MEFFIYLYTDSEPNDEARQRMKIEWRENNVYLVCMCVCYKFVGVFMHKFGDYVFSFLITIILSDSTIDDSLLLYIWITIYVYRIWKDEIFERTLKYGNISDLSYYAHISIECR